MSDTLSLTLPRAKARRRRLRRRPPDRGVVMLAFAALVWTTIAVAISRSCPVTGAFCSVGAGFLWRVVWGLWREEPPVLLGRYFWMAVVVWTASLVPGVLNV